MEASSKADVLRLLSISKMLNCTTCRKKSEGYRQLHALARLFDRLVIVSFGRRISHQRWVCHPSPQCHHLATRSSKHFTLVGFVSGVLENEPDDLKKRPLVLLIIAFIGLSNDLVSNGVELLHDKFVKQSPKFLVHRLRTVHVDKFPLGTVGHPAVGRHLQRSDELRRGIPPGHPETGLCCDNVDLPGSVRCATLAW